MPIHIFSHCLVEAIRCLLPILLAACLCIGCDESAGPEAPHNLNSDVYDGAEVQHPDTVADVSTDTGLDTTETDLIGDGHTDVWEPTTESLLERNSLTFVGSSPDGSHVALMDISKGIVDATLIIVTPQTGDHYGLANGALMFSPQPVLFDSSGQYLMYYLAKEGDIGHRVGHLRVHDFKSGTVEIAVPDALVPASRFAGVKSRALITHYDPGTGATMLSHFDLNDGVKQLKLDSFYYNPYSLPRFNLPTTRGGDWAMFRPRSYNLELWNNQTNELIALHPDLVPMGFGFRFGPNGARLAFEAEDSGQRRLHVLDIGDQSGVISPPGEGFVLSPTWSRISFLNTQSDEPVLQIHDFEEGKTTQPAPDKDGVFHRWDSSGRYLTFVDDQEKPWSNSGILYLWDHEDEVLTEMGPTPADSVVRYPVFSPDSRWLVYYTGSFIDGLELVAADLRTGKRTNLGRATCVPFVPEMVQGFGRVPVPDEDRCVRLGDGELVFMARENLEPGNGARNYHLTRVNLHTGERTVLAEDQRQEVRSLEDRWVVSVSSSDGIDNERPQLTDLQTGRTYKLGEPGENSIRVKDMTFTSTHLLWTERSGQGPAILKSVELPQF